MSSQASQGEQSTQKIGKSSHYESLREVLSKLVEERRQAIEIYHAMQQDTFIVRSGGVGLRLVRQGARYDFEFASTPLAASIYDSESDANRIANLLAGHHDRLILIDVVTAREATREAVSVARETVDRLTTFGVLSESQRDGLLSIDDQDPVSDTFVSARELIEKRHRARICAMSSQVDVSMDQATIH